jgi:hypothetical protein
MALFRRSASPPDPYLTMLSVADADHLRSIVRTVFAERGTEVTIGPADVVRDDGFRFWLGNVARYCAGNDRSDWPRIVREHIRRTDEASRTPFEESLGKAYVRLYRDGNLLDNPRVDFAPGLVQALVLDAPESMQVMRRETVERLGGWASVYAAALANLRREPPGRHKVLNVPGGAAVHYVEGKSVYTGSLAIVLADLARQVGDPLPPDAVWVLSVPDRHRLMWHVVRDRTAVFAVTAMARLAHDAFEKVAYELSPHVYWSDGTSYRQLTRPGPDGGVQIVPDDEFTAILKRVL